LFDYISFWSYKYAVLARPLFYLEDAGSKLLPKIYDLYSAMRHCIPEVW